MDESGSKISSEDRGSKLPVGGPSELPFSVEGREAMLDHLATATVNFMEEFGGCTSANLMLDAMSKAMSSVRIVYDENARLKREIVDLRRQISAKNQDDDEDQASSDKLTDEKPEPAKQERGPDERDNNNVQVEYMDQFIHEKLRDFQDAYLQMLRDAVARDNSSVVTPSTKIPVVDVVDTMTTFTDEWERTLPWLEEIEENAALFGWSELEILLAAKKLLRGDARKWVNARRGLTTWDAFKTFMISLIKRGCDAENRRIF